MHTTVTPVRTYLFVAVGLLALTAATYFAALVNLGPWNGVVALGIAALKATLIVLFFMHVRHSTGLTRLVIVLGLAWLALLIVGTLDDYWTRTWLTIPGK